MKKMILIGVFIAGLVGFCVYIEMNNRAFVENLPQAPTRKTLPEDNVVRHASKIDTAAAAVKQGAVAGKPVEDTTGVNEDIFVEPEWWGDDDSFAHRKDRDDPFGDYLQEAAKSSRGTLILEGMDTEALYHATYQQKLAQFGDRPEVHTIMDFQRKFDSDAPISFDERMKFQEALVTLYPSSTNRKTLAYYKWLYPRGNSPEDIGELTPGDLSTLRSMGIGVTQEETETGFRVTISTE